MDTEIDILRGIINWLDPTRNIHGINSKVSLINVARQVVIRALQSNPNNVQIRKAASEVYRIEHALYNKKNHDKSVRTRVSIAETVR